MANLIISRKCNLACSYCFANFKEQHGNTHFVSIETYSRMLDFLDQSGIDQVRMVGGEPTMHPMLDKLLNLAVERGKSILLFTNGIFSEQVLDSLLALPKEQCALLVNTNAHSAWLSTTQTFSTRKNNITRLGERCHLGFTIFSPSFDLSPVISLIVESGCTKSIRLGLAHPAGESNHFLHPKQYERVGHRIVEYAIQAAQAGIQVEFDCGFVRCMFSDEDIKLLKSINIACDWRCSPIIDIDLDGTAHHCFPLFGFEVRTDALDKDLRELRSDYELQLKTYRIAGIFPECNICPMRINEGCQGGCISAMLRRANTAHWAVEIPSPITQKIKKYFFFD